MTDDIWDEWNHTGATRYPQNHVVQFCFRQFPHSRAGHRALDLGCGSGVHTVFLAAEGFDVAATDKSPVGIRNTDEKLRSQNLKAVLRVESADVISFPSEHFDLVLCVGIFDTIGPKIAARSLHRLQDVLKPGGKGFFLFSSDLDDSVKGDNPWGFHGYTRDEVDSLFAHGFRKVWVDRCNLTYQGGQVTQDEWIVTLER